MTQGRRNGDKGTFDEDTEPLDDDAPAVRGRVPLVTSERVAELAPSDEAPSDRVAVPPNNIPFRTLYVDGRLAAPEVGDRFIYDQASGAVYVFRMDGDVTFGVDPDAEPVDRVFVGRAWNADLTQATAELYARLGNLDGVVSRIEGSHPTLLVFEVVG